MFWPLPSFDCTCHSVLASCVCVCVCVTGLKERKPMHTSPSINMYIQLLRVIFFLPPLQNTKGIFLPQLFLSLLLSDAEILYLGASCDCSSDGAFKNY